MAGEPQVPYPYDRSVLVGEEPDRHRDVEVLVAGNVRRDPGETDDSFRNEQEHNRRGDRQHDLR